MFRRERFVLLVELKVRRSAVVEVGVRPSKDDLILRKTPPERGNLIRSFPTGLSSAAYSIGSNPGGQEVQ